jgi:class 3 adenylate cyclase
MMVVQRLKSVRQGVSVSIGVASGRSFCGIIGSNRKATNARQYGQRREYTVMGAMVNLAARLMGKAAKNGVLVDSETRKRTMNVAGIKCVHTTHTRARILPATSTRCNESCMSFSALLVA